MSLRATLLNVAQNILWAYGFTISVNDVIVFHFIHAREKQSAKGDTLS